MKKNKHLNCVVDYKQVQKMRNHAAGEAEPSENVNEERRVP